MSAAEPQKRCRCIPPPPYSPVLTLAIVATAMTITQIGWAGFSVLIKATTAREDHHVDPLVFSLLRDAGAVPVLMILALSIDGVQPIKIKDLPVLCLGGTIGLFVNQVSYLYGIYLAGPSYAGIVQPLNPVITCIISVLIGTEQLGLGRVWGWLKVFGICSSVGGTIWLVKDGNPTGETGKSTLWGMLLLLLSVSASATYVLLQKRFIFVKDAEGVPRYLYPSTTATAYMYWFASLELGIAAFVRSCLDDRVFSGIDAEITIPLLYAIFIASVMAYCLVSYCNTLTTPTIVTTFWPLQSLGSILGAWLFLGDVITWVTGVCSAMIVIGLFSVCFAKYKEDTVAVQLEDIESEKVSLTMTDDSSLIQCTK